MAVGMNTNTLTSAKFRKPSETTIESLATVKPGPANKGLGATSAGAVFLPVPGLKIAQTTPQELQKHETVTKINAGIEGLWDGSNEVGPNVKAFIASKVDGFKGAAGREEWQSWGKEFVEAMAADLKMSPAEVEALSPADISKLVETLQSQISATWQVSLFGPDTLMHLAKRLDSTHDGFLNNLKTDLSSEAAKTFDSKWTKITNFYKEITKFDNHSKEDLVKFNKATVPSTDKGSRLASVARQVASEMPGIGRCKKGVRLAFEKAGFGTIAGLSAYMAAPQLAKRGGFSEASVSRNQLKQLPAGAVIVWNKGRIGGGRLSSAGLEHGHIEISLGNGGEFACDYQGSVNPQRAQSYRVFIPK